MKVGPVRTKVVESSQFACYGGPNLSFLLRQPFFGHGEAEAGKEIRLSKMPLSLGRLWNRAGAGALAASQWS